MLRWHEGDVLRKLRGAAGMTLEGLAEKSGLDLQTIHRIEIGQTKEPKRKTLTQLAAVFGLTAREFDDAIPRDHPGVPLRIGSDAEHRRGRPA
jgi:transcriptional regulator with XRE-family HTH domain